MLPKFILTILLIIAVSQIRAQPGTKTVSGIVLDKTNNEPVPFSTIRFSGIASGGILTDSVGRFSFRTRVEAGVLTVSGVGFGAKEYRFEGEATRNLVIYLEPEAVGLGEVVVKASGRTRYRNKDNPAVAFIRNVITRKDSNDARAGTDYSFKKYEKLTMSLSIDHDKVDRSRLLNKYAFLKNNLDSLTRPGRALVPAYLVEKSTRHTTEKRIPAEPVLLGISQSRIDQYLDEDGFDEFMDKIYGEPDVYDHDITLGNKRFLSPVAEIGPLFYEYYLLDTLKNTQPWQMKVWVVPRNSQDALLTGHLYVTLDGRYSIKKADLKVGDKVNINWVDDVCITMEYRTDTRGKYYLGKNKMSLHLGIFREGMGVFGEKTSIITEFVPEKAQAGYAPEGIAKTARAKGGDFGRVDRPEELTDADRHALNNIDSLKNSRSFRRSMAFGAFLLSGYVVKGPVEFGPFNSFYSFNPVEGSRWKFGGRTTDTFSRRVVFDAYMAYGSRDRQVKYSVGTTFSLTDSSIYRFPVRSVSLVHSKEVQIPGQELNFLTEDNFLLSFKRGENNRMWYNEKWQTEYLHETPQHISFRLGFRSQKLIPAGVLVFESTPETTVPRRMKNLRTSEIYTELRWAPHEAFFQGKRYRRPINNGYPVFTLRSAFGIRGLLGGRYTYQRIGLNVTKRFFLSQLGYTDVTAEAGAVFGKLPYPLLIIHRANQTYTYQLSSYNLMNFMEFASDRYAGVNLQHAFNGFFLNKIPLVKKLGLRELVTLKVLSGTLTERNDPECSKGLFRMPFRNDGKRLTHSLGAAPYIEGSVGLSNIFKILRVDLVRRFTYLDHPQVSRWGVRMKLNVDF